MQHPFANMAAVDAGGSPHYLHCAARYLNVYAYDPADDGPEVETITRILAADWNYQIEEERTEVR